MKGGGGGAFVGFGVPFGSLNGPFRDRRFGSGVHCCSAGSQPHFCLGLASRAWSYRAMRDTSVLRGACLKICGLLQLGREFAPLLILLLWCLSSE